MLDDRAKTMTGSELLEVREYGPTGSIAAVLHGGPGARGSARLLAEALADPLHVLEPLQRRSSDTPLTVEQHVDDLGRLLEERVGAGGVVLVGESWGAMLALATAAEYPHHVSALVLVGCGTFDRDARAVLQVALAARTTPDLESARSAIARSDASPSERALRARRIEDPLYTFERAEGLPEPAIEFDLKGHLESWADMLRLQEIGVYPRAFSSIKCPALMLHGQYDPHPGRMIHESLKPHIPQLEYGEFDRCGHSPWIEKHARGKFLKAVRRWVESALRKSPVVQLELAPDGPLRGPQVK